MSVRRTGLGGARQNARLRLLAIGVVIVAAGACAKRVVPDVRLGAKVCARDALALETEGAKVSLVAGHPEAGSYGVNVGLGNFDEKAIIVERTVPPVVFVVEIRDLASGELVLRLRDAAPFNCFRHVDGGSGLALPKVPSEAVLVEVSMEKADRASAGNFRRVEQSVTAPPDRQQPRSGTRDRGFDASRRALGRVRCRHVSRLPAVEPLGGGGGIEADVRFHRIA